MGSGSSLRTKQPHGGHYLGPSSHAFSTGKSTQKETGILRQDPFYSGKAEKGERQFPGGSPGMGFPVLYCSELKNLQGERGRRTSGQHSRMSSPGRHTDTHTLICSRVQEPTHSYGPYTIPCRSTLPSLTSPGPPLWKRQTSPSPDTPGTLAPVRWGLLGGSALPGQSKGPQRTRGRDWAEGSLLDDGSQLCAKVLAVEPLLEQDVRSVLHVVPARAKDR